MGSSLRPSVFGKGGENPKERRRSSHHRPAVVLTTTHVTLIGGHKGQPIGPLDEVSGVFRVSRTGASSTSFEQMPRVGKARVFRQCKSKTRATGPECSQPGSAHYVPAQYALLTGH